MTRYLVTGGDGFVGANFVPFLLNQSPPDTVVVNIDRLTYGQQRLHCDDNRYFFYKVDLNDADKMKRILEQHKIDTVIHLAAQTHVDVSFQNSLQFTKDNVLGTHTLLECCRVYGGITRFIHFSTDEVYGEVSDDHEGCVEQSLLNPTNPYSATKTGAEFLVRAYAHSFKFPYIITRANNIYGPLQYPDKIVPMFSQILMRGEKCNIHGDGMAKRSFIHVHDVCRAIWTVLEHGRLSEIYNIGSTEEFNVLETHSKLMAVIRPGENPQDYLNFVDDRPFNDRRYAIDMTKLQKLGWSQTITLEDGLMDTIKWYKNNPDHFNPEKLKWLVYGHSGHLGEKFCDYITTNGGSVIRAIAQVDEPDDVGSEMENNHPDRVVYITGMLNKLGEQNGTVDKKEDLSHEAIDNIFAPLVLAEETRKREIHLTIVGPDMDSHMSASGSVFKGFTDRFMKKNHENVLTCSISNADNGVAKEIAQIFHMAHDKTTVHTPMAV